MKKLILAIAIFLGASPLWAEIMTYQGRLKESGIPATGNRLFTFEFCDAEDGSGLCLIAPGTPASFAVANGLFKSTITIHPSVNLAVGTWYLRVTVGSSVLTPLERLTAVPYAVFASSAGYAAGAVQKAGDTMSGQLTLADSTLTVTGNEFSVGGSTFVVKNGYVGMGTDTPDARLHVVSDNGYVHLASPGSAFTLNLIPQTYATAAINNNANGPIVLSVANNEYLRVDRDGNIGISSATPSYRLSVSSGAGETGTIMAVSTGTSNLFWVAGDGAHATKFYGDGSGLSGVTGATDNTKVIKTGDTMSGPLSILSDDLANDTLEIVATGIEISTGGAIRTRGLGNGTAIGNARGMGAVDLQSARANSAQVATGDFSVIGGGQNNAAGGMGATLAGGHTNAAGGNYSFVGGGVSNNLGAYGSVIAGGQSNKIGALFSYSAILGGISNEAAANFTAVGGGQYNVVSGSNSVIAGGIYNLVKATSAVVAGGEYNSATGLFSSVGGGSGNTAGFYGAVAAGGTRNTASGSGSFVGGGDLNLASRQNTVVAGGIGNKADGNYAAVGGGIYNIASGYAASIQGGYGNVSGGNYSWAGGYSSSSPANGSFTWSDSEGTRNDNTVADRAVFKSRGGFLVTGSTNTAISGTLDRAVFITGNGLVGVSTGLPQAALDVVSTGTLATQYAQIWRDSTGLAIASMTADGRFSTALAMQGDNLGNHNAAQNLQLNWNNIYTVSSVTARGHITAAAYQINGSTVLAQPGSNNIFAGSQSGLNNAAGGSNAYFGANTAVINSAGSYNSVLGAFAGYGGSGSYSSNTLVGYHSGYYLGANGDANVFIGYNSGNNVFSGNNNIIVGFEQRASAAGAANELNIGGVLFGKLDQRSIGISTRVPQAALDVVSTATGAGYFAQIWRDSAGNVVSSVSSQGIFYGNGSGLTGVTASGAVQKSGDTMPGHLTISFSSLTVIGDTSEPHSMVVGTGTLPSHLYVSTTGAIGLGTVNPQAPLHLSGTAPTEMLRIANPTANNTGMTFRGIANGWLGTIGSDSGGFYYNVPVTSKVGFQFGGVEKASVTAQGAVSAASYQVNGSTVLAVGSASPYSLFVGMNAGRNNTDSTFNTLVGNGAGYASPGATFNRVTAVGADAGQSLLSGSYNSLLGVAAGYLLSDGGFNTFIGALAGYSDTSGSHNVVVGQKAGYFTSSGSSNTLVGDFAGYGLGGNSFSDNSVFGANAGYGLTTGSRNILIGVDAGRSINVGSDNLVIGNGQGTSAPGAGSELNIGGVIFGSLNQRTVGISTRVPQAALDVVSTGTGAGFYAQIWRNSSGVVVSSVNSLGVFYGNGSGLTGVTVPGAVQKAGDTMQGALDMNGFVLTGVSTITMLNGSLAIVPPGTPGSNDMYGITIGSNAMNSSFYGVGIGHSASNNTNRGVGLGHNASNNNDYGVGVGGGASNNYSYGAGVGPAAGYNFNSGVGVGYNAGNNSNYGVGVGANAANNDSYAVGVGAFAQNVAGYGAALGAYSYASSSATALGAQAKANAELSLALGYGTVNNSTGTASFGNYAVLTSSALSAAYYQVSGSTVLALPGSDNTFVGRNAGRSGAAPGSSNTFLGSNAGSATSGQFNTFVGDYAGNANTSGQNNTFMGSNAALNNTTGSENAAYGRYAAYNNRTGSFNAILGDSAGFGIANNSYSSSTLVGYRAGYGLTTGYGNIFLGYRAGYSVTTGTGNIIIGFEKDVYTPTDNNVLNIGGVLFGELSEKTIGINSFLPPTPVKPQAALDVISTGTASGVYAQIWRNSSGVAVASVTSLGRFYGDGAGLTNITAAGSVQKAGDRMTGQLYLDGTGGSDVSLRITRDATGPLITAGLTAGATAVIYAESGSIGLFTQNPAHRVGIGAGMTEALTVTQNRVGANNTSPYYTLDVNGPGRFADQIIAGGSVTVAGSSFSVGGSTLVVNAGRVGINWISPEAALQVSGGAKFLSSAGTSYILTAGSAARPDMFFVSSAGFVGAGDFTGVSVDTYAVVTLAPVLKTGMDGAVGLTSLARTDNASAVNATGPDQVLAGGNFEVEIGGDDSVSSVVGLRTKLRRETTGGGTVGKAYGLFLDDIGTANGSGVITDTYGIYIGNQTSGYVGTQTNAPYAIYSQDPGAKIYLAGNLGLGASNPGARLDVVAINSDPATMSQIWRNSLGTIVSSMSATGVMMAAKFVGDGGGLTNLSGVQKTGDTMTGALTIAGSSLTIRPAAGAAYSLYVSSADGVAPAFTVKTGGEVYTAGRVGIGASAPAEALDISGRVQISTRAGGNDVTDGLLSNGSGGMEFYSSGTKYMKVSNGGGYIGIGPSANVYSNTMSPRLQVKGSMSVGSGYNTSQPPANSLVVEGRLGAGTPAPDAALSVVQADVAVSSYTVHIGTSATAYHLVVTTAGWVGINTRQPQAPLHLTAATKDEGIVVEHNSDTSEGSYLALVKARGTADSQSIVAEGDNLGVLAFGGYNAAPGDPFPMAAAIVGRVDGVASISPATDMPGRLEFMTAADGTTETITRMVIRSDGGVGIATGTPQAMLDIRSTSTMAQIWRDASGVVRASMTASGVLYAQVDAVSSKVSKTGDNMSGNLTINVNPALYMYDFATTGIQVSTAGSIVTVGNGNGSSGAGARGMGAVDLQTARTIAGQVAQGDFSTLSGGSYNTILGSNTVLAGGRYNLAAGTSSVISGGENNYTYARLSTVGGGANNTADMNYAGVFAGQGNIADGLAAFVGGGQGNTVEFNYGAIAGGMNNTVGAAADYGFVGGGYQNTADGTHSVVAGGWNNTATGLDAFVGAGYMNFANGEKSVLGGGTFNTADAQYGVISGGYENKMQPGATAGFIGGGSHNTSTAAYSSVGGGYYNTSSATYSGVFSGYQNVASSQSAVVAGGQGNTADGSYGAIGGGQNNYVTGLASLVAGGAVNQVLKNYSAVNGGHENIVRGVESVVGGGYSNEVNADAVTISGGYDNAASGYASSVSGGVFNTATGYGAAVLGGANASAAGQYAAVIAGNYNTAKGNYSFAGGYRSSSTAAGTFTWSDSQGVVTENAVQDQVRFKARGGFVVSGSTSIADPKFTVTGAGDVLLDNDRTLAWGYMPAPYITGNDGTDLLAFGLTGVEKMKLQNNQLTLYNANLVLSTTSADVGIVFQDGSVQKSAAQKVVSVYKPVNLIKTLDALPAADPHLQFSIGANEKWAFEFNLYVYTTDPSGVADFRVGLVGPAAVQLRTQYDLYAENGLTVLAGGIMGGYGEYMVDWTGTVPSPGTRVIVKGTIENGATAGTMAVTWSQNVSAAVNTTVLKGSYLLAHKLN